MNLQITSIWPYFLITTLLLGLGAVIDRTVPFYRREITAQSLNARAHAIDGLRGYLAYGVFFHHSVIAYFFFLTGRWGDSPSAFYATLGQFGVAVFFNITAFLFWSKVLNGPLDVKKFFIGRVRRLAPLYWFTVVLVFLNVLSITGFVRHSTPGELLGQGLSWASFGFLRHPDINGVANTFVFEPVYWSLAYEWAFYLLLPILAVFVRGAPFLFLILLILLYGILLRGDVVLLNFVAGACAAHVVASGRLRHFLSSGWATIVAVGALVSLFTFYDEGYGIPQALLIFVFFLPVASGNTLFGLLKLRPAHLMGIVSYSVYLLHGIVLNIVLRCIDRVHPVAQLLPIAFWVSIAICGLLVTLASAFTYRFIEHVFYHGVARGMPPPALAVSSS